MNRNWITILVFAATVVACSHSEVKTASAESQQPPAAPTAGAAVAPTSTETPAAAQKVDCSKNSETRHLEIRTKDKGCEVGYVKGGKESVIASARWGTSYCETKLGNVRTKLEGAGYTCK